MDERLPGLLARLAASRGISPVDLATAISYETGGTFDDWKKGPTTRWGQHRGLIQMGDVQRRKYGYEKDSTLDQKIDAIGRYLDDTGVRPGMGLADIYSAINAGGPGRYSASDESSGGAPGTVLDKVTQQMGPHQEKAMRMYGLSLNGMAPPMDPRRLMQDPNMIGPPMPGVSMGPMPAVQVGAPGATTPPTPPTPSVMSQLGAGDIKGALGSIGGNQGIQDSIRGISSALGGGGGGQKQASQPLQAPSIQTNEGGIAAQAPSLLAQILQRKRQAGGGMMGGMY